MKRSILAAAAVLAVSLPAAGAGAATLWDNGGPQADGGEQLVHAVGLADAGLDGHGVAAECAELFAQRLGLLVAVVIVDDDVGAGLRQLGGDGPADAARGTSDQGHLAGQRQRGRGGRRTHARAGGAMAAKMRREL